MAKVIGKGTVLEEEISAVYTAVAQVISLELPEAESETVEADTLDNSDAGIPHEATGRSEGGSLSGELFFDPALAGHQEFTDHISDPAGDAPINYKVQFADSATTEWIMSVVGWTLGGTIAVDQLVQANFSLKLTKLVTYPT